MLHDLAVAHPLMVFAIAVTAAFYFTGVYLLVGSLTEAPELVQDEPSELHRVPQAR